MIGLLLLAGDEENKFLDRKLQQINDELLSLKQLKKRTEQAIEQNKNRISVQEIIQMISADDITIHEYSDTLTYRIIEQITILSKEEIRIRFVGGYEITQSLLQ